MTQKLTIAASKKIARSVDEIDRRLAEIGLLMTSIEFTAMRAVLTAVTDTIRESGALGAPSSALYLALRDSGCTLTKYQAIMGALVTAGKVRQEGHCYFIT